MAVGTLAIGLTFIGGTFLVGIYLTTLSTERTIAAVVADEAFAKVRLYGLDITDPNISATQQIPFENLKHTMSVPDGIDPNEYSYPSVRLPLDDKQYFWSALCRKVSPDSTERLVQVTVFVSRRIRAGTTYVGGLFRPVPVEVSVSDITGTGNENRLQIENSDEVDYITDGCTIVSNATGRIYRVLERSPVDLDIIILDRPWQSAGSTSVWVVPPPSRGRKPGIAVYQRLIRF